ncbi:DUF485 domain-containing protein [Terasakiella sp.]|uniref:DUF485 domain-containing protein n=1 Tax=Terasakiella sp. TaxID=2034861 RepID=UPI003AA9CE7A
MSEHIYERIKKDPRFSDLQKRRGRFALILSIIVLTVYYGFIMVVAFAPEKLATPLAEGMTTSVGIPIGAAIIVLAWLSTGIYVRRANSEFDTLNKQIVEDASK